MPLHINEMGIEIKIGAGGPNQSASGGCSDDDDAKQRETEERLVDETARRVLAMLKATGTR